MSEDNDAQKPNKVIKDTVAKYAANESATATKPSRNKSKSPAPKLASQSAIAQELEPWERPLESYTEEELLALHSDYTEEATQLVEVGIVEYSQHLRELDKV